MNSILQDINYAFRMLRKSRGFTAVAILTLALGIGANTAIFSVVNAVLLKPLPLRQPNQLVELWETEAAAGNYPLDDADFVDWRAQNRTFDDMSIYTYREPVNISGAGAPEQVRMVETQAHFFSVLGISPQIGRTFSAGEDIKGKNHVVILSNALWNSHFGGSPAAIGKTLTINSESYTVIGVMPAWFTAPGTANIWIPMDFSPESLRGRGSHYLRALGRLKDGVTIDQARADLNGIAARIAKTYPKSNEHETAILIPLQTELTGEARTPLWILFGAVALVLLIACANVANLLLARSIGRRREMALRGAIGASRGRLMRQLLTESLILSLAGGLAGAFLAYDLVGALASLAGPQLVSPNPVRVDTWVLLFCIGVSATVGILFGLAPAFETSRVNLVAELKSRTGSSGAGDRGIFVRDALVAGEIALSLALLAGAGLLLRTFHNMRMLDLGVRSDHVLSGYVLVPEKNYSTFDTTIGFANTFVDRLRNSPGIRDAALNILGPLSSDNNGYIHLDGEPDDARQGDLVVGNEVTPNYFRTLGMKMIAGRELNDADTQGAVAEWRALLPLEKAHDDKSEEAEAAKYVVSAVISKEMAEHFWPNQNPLERIFRNGALGFRVVGVVNDVRNNGMRDKPMYAAYVPLAMYLGDGPSVLYVSVLTSGRAESGEATMRSVLQSIDGTLALSEVQTIPQIAEASFTDTRDEALLLGALSGLALLLAAIGTYGVMSYVVSQRTNEIGIRVALGAQRADVMRLVLRQGTILVGAGLGLGLLLAIGGARLMRDLLFGVAPFDAFTYAGVAVVLAGISLLACYIPARRAMRVDPMVALRYE